MSFYGIYVSASRCKANDCSCDKAQMRCSKFCGCAKTADCQNKWNQQCIKEPDNYGSEDESDSDD